MHHGRQANGLPGNGVYITTCLQGRESKAERKELPILCQLQSREATPLMEPASLASACWAQSAGTEQ